MEKSIRNRERERKREKEREREIGRKEVSFLPQERKGRKDTMRLLSLPRFGQCHSTQKNSNNSLTRLTHYRAASTR
jgi:hypothetical protein